MMNAAQSQEVTCSSGSLRPVALMLASVATLGVGYNFTLLFTSLLEPYRFPIPYAFPIFDTPFALVGLGVGYLCLERHRVLQDSGSVVLGIALSVAGILALAHILTQPDPPDTPGVWGGMAPYFFLLSFLIILAGVALACYSGERPLPLTERMRMWIGIGVVGLSLLLSILVFAVSPLLPSLVTQPGRLTPLAIWIAGVSHCLLGAWALWAGGRRFWRQRDWLGGFLLLAGTIWLCGLAGFLICPFRDGVSWYVAGFSRPLGVGVVFAALLREQTWLYREAHAHMRNLEGLNAAGRAVVESLDSQEILDTVTAKAVELMGADGAILFRLDPTTQTLRAVSQAGEITATLLSGYELQIGQGASGVAVLHGRPAWLANLEVEDLIPFPAEVRTRLLREGLKAVLAIPVPQKRGGVFGALSFFYRSTREFSRADIELAAAYGAQASVGIDNAQAFAELEIKARHAHALQDSSQRLFEASDEEAIWDTVLRVTERLLQADCVALFRVDSNRNVLCLESGFGWRRGVVGEVWEPVSTKSFVGHAFVRRETTQTDNLSGGGAFAAPAYLIAHGVRTALATPLTIWNTPVGVLAAYYRTPRPVSGEDRRVLSVLGIQGSVAAEKALLNAELQANIRRLQETQAQLVQADKLTAIGTLLSGMAHELNNPLAAILLSAQLLQRQQDLPEAIRKRLVGMEKDCERASRIMKDLLAFARRQAPARRAVSVSDVVRAALTLAAPAFELGNIRVVTNLPELVPISVDPNQLQQVLLNLFNNAAQAMNAAHERGTLTVRSSQRGSEVSIVVEDDGPGIPPEHLRRVFDPFFTTKPAGEGTGLGLSVSIGIIEAHGGRMQVENLPGSGARFTISLPVRNGTGSERDPIGSSRGDGLGTGRRGTILVVDDEERLRVALTDSLDTLGHTVESAASGGAAMASLKGQTYDVVMLDLRLGDMHGRDVWRWLLARDPAQAARVVFMTGDTMSTESEEFLTGVGRPFLAKPITLEALDRVVSEVLNQKGAFPGAEETAFSSLDTAD